MRTDRQTENKQTENSKPEATLIPVDSRGERANYSCKIMIFLDLIILIYDKIGEK